MALHCWGETGCQKFDWIGLPSSESNLWESLKAKYLVFKGTVASQCLGYRLCAKFRVVFKIPKVPNSLSVQISGSFINEAWYHFWPNI